VAQFRLANQSLVLLAQNDLTNFLSSFDLVGSPDVVRDALLKFFPELVTVYGDTAALLGADFYDELRNVPASAASYRAVMASPAPIVQAASSVRWGVGPLWAEGGAAIASVRLAGSLQRLVMQSGRDTIWGAAGRDPVRTAVARVPTGTKTCKWCTMIASRGAVYGSKQAAGSENDYHDNCDCVPTVIRSESDFPEGHDVKEFQRLYALGSGVGRDLPVSL
jgi:hypothetical protein